MKLTKEETPENMWDIVKAQEKKNMGIYLLLR